MGQRICSEVFIVFPAATGIALELNHASVGTLLARARHAFRQGYEHPDAP